MRKKIAYAIIVLTLLSWLLTACAGGLPQLQATPAGASVALPGLDGQPTTPPVAATAAPPAAAAAAPSATLEPATAAPSPTPLPTETLQPVATPTVIKGSSVSTLTAAKLVRVIDGVTIEVSIGGKTYPVRYIGVEPLGDGSAALAKNKQLLAGQALNLARDVTDQDAQGRLLRYVYTRAYMVNAELARQGYVAAVSTPPDTLFQELLANMEKEARGAKRGVWATLANTGTPPATPATPTATR